MLKFAALRPSQSPLFVLKFDLLLATRTSPTTLNSQASSLIYRIATLTTMSCGYETKDLVDVVTGDITTIQSLRHTSDLDTGEMYVFLCKVEAWAMNIGCHLTIPQSCEFQLLRDKQEA